MQTYKLQRFKEQYKEKQLKPLNCVITGGGFSFLDILKMPGASSIISDVRIPYSEKASDKFFNYNATAGLANVGYCSLERTKDYMKQLRLYYSNSPDFGYLIVNAALTSNRERRGDNKVYIAYNDHAITSVIFNRMTWNAETCDITRRLEDEVVRDLIMYEIMEDLEYIEETKELYSFIERHDPSFKW